MGWAACGTSRRRFAHRQPLSGLPPQLPRNPERQASFIFSGMRRQRGFFHHNFQRFSSSGCFFDDVTQVCYFEPFLSLLGYAGGFDPFYPGFGFGEDSATLGDDLNEGLMQSEISEVPPTTNPGDDDAAQKKLPANPGANSGAVIEDQALGRGIFLLVLNNGATLAVTDYWVADGYLEYITPDGARSHIPLEALDLQNTVNQNAPRGLSFVLRSTPGRNR